MKSFAIYMLSAACLSQQTHFHIQQSRCTPLLNMVINRLLVLEVTEQKTGERANRRSKTDFPAGSCHLVGNCANYYIKLRVGEHRVYVIISV